MLLRKRKIIELQEKHRHGEKWSIWWETQAFLSERSKWFRTLDLNSYAKTVFSCTVGNTGTFRTVLSYPLTILEYTVRMKRQRCTVITVPYFSHSFDEVTAFWRTIEICFFRICGVLWWLSVFSFVWLLDCRTSRNYCGIFKIDLVPRYGYLLITIFLHISRTLNPSFRMSIRGPSWSWPTLP